MEFEEIISIKKGKLKHTVTAIFGGEEVTAAILIPDYCAKALIMDCSTPYSAEQIQYHKDSEALIAELIIEEVGSIDVECPECNGDGYMEFFDTNCSKSISSCCGGCTITEECPECLGSKTVERELVIY